MDLLELMQPETGSDTKVSSRLQKSVASVDTDLIRQVNIIKVDPFTQGDKERHAAAVDEATKLNVARAVLVAGATQWATGEIPAFLRGFKTRQQADRLMRLLLKHPEDPKRLLWTWDQCHRNMFLMEVGVRTELDFHACREWVRQAKRDHSHPEIIRFREQWEARRKRFFGR